MKVPVRVVRPAAEILVLSFLDRELECAMEPG